MARRKKCRNCEFHESRQSCSQDHSFGMKVDLCGKLMDDGVSKKYAVIVLLEKCPLEVENES